jgi:hypothetical protein
MKNSPIPQAGQRRTEAEHLRARPDAIFRKGFIRVCDEDGRGGGPFQRRFDMVGMTENPDPIAGNEQREFNPTSAV